jgi:hypothetical protein
VGDFFSDLALRGVEPGDPLDRRGFFDLTPWLKGNMLSDKKGPVPAVREMPAL